MDIDREAVRVRSSESAREGVITMDEVASRLEGVSLEDDYPLICSHPIEGVSLEADCRARAGTKDWRWLLWESDVARAKLHPDLGPAWTAVLKEACCVRVGVDRKSVV